MEDTVFHTRGRWVNVGQNERILSVIAGSALVVNFVVKPSWWKILLALMGGYQIYRGVTGHCTLYRLMNINRADSGRGDIRVEHAVTIQRPVEEVYAFWRDLENLPRFMDHLKSVTVRGDGVSQWVAKAPLGAEVEWTARITADRVNEAISWQSLPESQIENCGSVRFRPATGSRGTEVIVRLEYAPPGGSAGAAIARLLGEEPDQQITEDLRRLKRLLETGEIITTQGQSSGRRKLQVFG